MQISFRFWIVFTVLINVSSANISQRLYNFETLHHSDLHTRVRRSADPNPSSHLHQIWFKAYHRQFHLILRQSNIIPHDFQAKVIKGNKVEYFPVHSEDFLQGTLSDDDSSRVEAHWEGNSLSASITTASNVYIVEPSWRHMSNSYNHSMIVYRQSDIIDSHFHRSSGAKIRSSFCGVDNDINNHIHSHQTPFTNHKRVRLKRETFYNIPSYRVCQLVVVADYQFYKNVGGSNKHATANYIIGILNRVNGIYTSTRWPDDSSNVRGLGFEIAEMKIHEEATTNKGEHYNMPNAVWNTTHLLQVFSRGTEFKDFCLAHLFTYHKFTRGVLGLAYIAGKGAKQPGGICSTGPSPGQVFTLNGYASTFNTGWSSAQNSEGNRVLSLEAALVTAHELGHNWGSEHDPDTENCAPKNGGKYLMYQYSVTGYEHNNQIFSPCTRRYIFNVIKTKSQTCFKESKGLSMCGNGRKEGAEECDGGWSGDNCCTKHCKLVNGAMCSPMNYECCTKTCQIASRNTVCQSLPNDLVTCKNISMCNGISENCPTASNKTDNSTCVDGGRCRAGVCLNYCEIRGKYPCICPQNSGFACYRCCKVLPNATECVPEPEKEILPDGRPCYKGTCKRGQCEKQISDVVQRLFNIMERITGDEFVVFMKSNIVGTIIVFSLVLWIPASCTFSHFDKKRERKIRKENSKCKSRSTYTLLLEEEKRKLTHVKLKHVGGSVIRYPGNHFYINQGHFNSPHQQDQIKESNV